MNTPYPTKPSSNKFSLLQLFGLSQAPSTVVRAVDGDSADSHAKLAEWWNNNFAIAGDRTMRYRIFREMDRFGLVQSVLDLYAEEATQLDYATERTMWIESNDNAIRKDGEACLHNLMAEDTVYQVTRRMCLYGDDFPRLLYESGKGVLGWDAQIPDSVHRVDDKYRRLIGFSQRGTKFRDGTSNESWPWDFIHFRLLGRFCKGLKDNRDDTRYGTAMLDALYRPWRLLVMVEDALLMFRLRRVPDRNLIMLDTGGLSDSDAALYSEEWRKAFRRVEFLDPSDSNYDKYHFPITPFDDVIVPMRGENNTRVDRMQGSGTMDRVYDLEHFRDAFFAAARVPKGYLGFERDVDGNKALSQQDVRFARTIKRIRRSLIRGMRQAIDIHLTLRGHNPMADSSKYIVQMSTISYLDEVERLELVRTRSGIVAELGRLAREMGLNPEVWSRYLLETYLRLDSDTIEKLMVKGTDGEEGDDPFERFENYALHHHLTEDQKSAYTPEVIRQMFPARPEQSQWEPSNKEKAKVHEAMEKAFGLRFLVERMASCADEYKDDMQMQQSDPSLTLPFVGSGESSCLTDSVQDDARAVQLREDMKSFKMQGVNDGS